MGAVRNILKAKGNVIYSVSPEITVFKALEIMLEKNISALLIMENLDLVGIFTEREYARKVILQGKSSKGTKVRDIMSVNINSVTPDSSIDQCMQLMTDKFIRHLPVMDEGKLIGVVSIGDVVKYIIDEQKFIIENMEHYIGGS